MLFANNTLYAWVRNIKNDGTQSRLRYATAKYNQPGSTWSWAPWTFTEFGYPVFVQDGQSYTNGGAYVYVVAYDGPSAYTPAD
jgi:hypothetical protein